MPLGRPREFGGVESLGVLPATPVGFAMYYIGCVHVCTDGCDLRICTSCGRCRTARVWSGPLCDLNGFARRMVRIEVDGPGVNHCPCRPSSVRTTCGWIPTRLVSNQRHARVWCKQVTTWTRVSICTFRTHSSCYMIFHRTAQSRLKR